MIFLSVGMPRAGSGWYYNLTHELLVACGAQDARVIRKKYHLERVLTEVNCNIGVLSWPRLCAVLIPSLLGNSFVIKAHAAPTAASNFFMRQGWMKTTYIFRDPRDALLSALEHGQQAREAGYTNAFAQLLTLEDGLKFMLQYTHIWESWSRQKDVLRTRYEDLINDYDAEVERLLGFLNLQDRHDHLQPIIDKFRPRQASDKQKGLHFRQGKVGRFLQAFDEEKQHEINAAFSAYLEQMGYPR